MPDFSPEQELQGEPRIAYHTKSKKPINATRVIPKELTWKPSTDQRWDNFSFSKSDDCKGLKYTKYI